MTGFLRRLGPSRYCFQSRSLRRGDGVSTAKTLVAAAFLALAAGACGGADTGTSSRAATDDLDTNQPVFDTWEEAAIAEAERLNPELGETRTDRIEIAPQDERVRVQAPGGYCHIFGGKFHAEQGWQANDLGTC